MTDKILYKTNVGNWTQSQQDEAIKEGWCFTLAHSSDPKSPPVLKISSCDDTKFDSDNLAVAHIYSRKDDTDFYRQAHALWAEDIIVDETQAEPSQDATPITDQAYKLVYGDRQGSYGNPEEDFARTAKIWGAILGMEVTAKQVALCMVGVKLSRETHKPKTDSMWIYVATLNAWI